MPVTIACEPVRQPGIVRLLELSDAYMATLYPADSNHAPDLDSLDKPEISFFVARRDSEIAGCCALVRKRDGTGEIKRLFVSPQARGLSLGKCLMQAVEQSARYANLSAIRLETGIHQPEAIALYRSLGYVDIAPFDDYQQDPLSLFMEKRL
nr:GNAT family N-acetyltransferase [uncultured Rhizobium sp.]